MLRSATADDCAAIYQLYHATAATPGGLARLQYEVTLSYVENFVHKALADGLCLVAELNNVIVGEIHAYRPRIYCFEHVLSDLTMCVASHVQGHGIGRQIFSAFLQQVEHDMPTILRVELIARESNQKAITFYQSLGFQIEGTFTKRIKNVDGSLEADIALAWLR